jgi:hypothetical protein
MPRVTHSYNDPRATLHDPTLGFAEFQLKPYFLFRPRLVDTTMKLKAGANCLRRARRPAAKARCHIHQGTLDAAVDVVALREFGQSREQDTQLSPYYFSPAYVAAWDSANAASSARLSRNSPAHAGRFPAQPE